VDVSWASPHLLLWVMAMVVSQWARVSLRKFLLPYKSDEECRRNLFKVNLKNGTLHHAVVGTHGAAKVLMRPAVEGTGIIAGGAMRAVFEAVGVRDVSAKCIGSSNPYNVVRATLNGLRALNAPSEIAAKRGKNLDEILG